MLLASTTPTDHISMPPLWYACGILIGRSPEEVFDFCSDLRNEMVWNPKARSVEKLTEGPVGVGTRFLARWSNAGPTVVEIVRFDRPHQWESHSITRGLEVWMTGAVEEDPMGAWYRARLQLRPHGIAALYAPLALRAMRRQEPWNMQLIRDTLGSSSRDGSP